MSIDLRLGDCLSAMGELADGSIDLVLCDLPYGTTSLRWDSVIPFRPLWAHYRRILTPRGAVVLTASQPFTSMLVVSNPEWFKYCSVWEKTRATDFMNAKNKPLKIHEDVVVFSPGTTANKSKRRMTYHPQGLERAPYRHKRLKPVSTKILGTPRPNWVSEREVEFTNYPKSIIRIPSEDNGKTVHPTQKPVALMEYLIKTYSNEGETVLDNCFGSGTTGIACLNTGRNFIGIEKDPGYFAIAESRIAEAQASAPLFLAS